MYESGWDAAVKTTLNNAQGFLFERPHTGEEFEESNVGCRKSVFLLECLCHASAVRAPGGKVHKEPARQFCVRTVDRQPSDERAITMGLGQGLASLQVVTTHTERGCEREQDIRGCQFTLQDVHQKRSAGQRSVP